jgi:hypothetical protein
LLKQFGKVRNTVGQQININKMKELNKFREFLQENEVHEGTWSVGSPESRDKLAQMLQNVQIKNDSVEGMLQALEIAKDYAYGVAGDDNVFDYLDAATAELEKGEEGFDPDHFSDHITDAILAVSRLQENDSVLDEIINEENEEVNEAPAVFNEIDNNMKLIAVHMTAEETLEDLVAEFSIIPGGTKILAQALKNIVRDNKLTGDPEEYASIGFEESLDEGLTQDILKKHPKKYKDEKAVKAAAAKLMKSPKFKGKGIGPVLQALLKGKE